MNAYQNRFSQDRARQQGFTLIEILIAISLLSLIAAFAIFSYNGNKSKGQILFSTMQSIAQAALRFQQDTSCVPERPLALFNIGFNADNTCNVDVSATWGGPYMKALPTNARGNVIPQIAPNGTIEIDPANPQMTGTGRPFAFQLAIVGVGIPTAIADEAMRACSGGSAVPASNTFVGNCSESTPANGMRNIQYVYDPYD